MSQVDVVRKPAKCRTCRAAIFWATSAATGRPGPIDFEPRGDGNVRIVGADSHGSPLIEVYGRKKGEPAPALFSVEPLYVSHWMTCPKPPPRVSGR